jgi:hypothetical protein
MHYKNNQLNRAIEELSLAIQGGAMEDGTVVEGLPLDYGRVAEYYAIYGLALAKSSRCSEAVPIFQTIRSGVPEDEINVYNAEQGLIICQENLEEVLGEEEAEAVTDEIEEEQGTPAP